MTRLARAGPGTLSVLFGLILLPIVAGAEGPCPGYADYVVKRGAQGEINWGENFLLAHGTGRAPYDEEGTSSGRVKARRAAEVSAYAQALALALNLSVDGQQRVQDYLARNPGARGRLQGRIQQGELAEEREVGGEARVTIKAPFFGVSGLALTFVGDAPPSPAPTGPGPSPLGVEVSGVIIDARRMRVGAALLLRVADEDGGLVYDASRLAPAVLRERGTASYAQCAGPPPPRGGLAPRLRHVALFPSFVAQGAPVPPRAGRWRRRAPARVGNDELRPLECARACPGIV